MRVPKLPMVMTDGYMNRKQLAAYLGVSVVTVINLVKNGTLPAPIVLGPRVHRWKKVDVDLKLSEKKLAADLSTRDWGKTIGDEY